MKIFTSFLRQFLLIVGLMLVFSFVAWGEEATLSFEDKAQRTFFSSTISSKYISLIVSTEIV